MAVEVVHFNPARRPRGLLGKLQRRRPLNNFGDLLGPLLVDRIIRELGLRQPEEARRLVAIGSIMRLTEPGDTVWGAGVNGRSMDTGAAPDIDVRAVRGPRTRQVLLQAGADVPAVYGDPALLWSRYWPRDSYLSGAEASRPRDVTIVPNHNDLGRASDPRIVSPLGDPHEIIAKIAASSFVCGSSLHGVVIAESFGIPARLITSEAEPAFKYDDYYSGTGRMTYRPAESVAEAIAMGGEPPAQFDGEKLLRAFPRDLYTS